MKAEIFDADYVDACRERKAAELAIRKDRYNGDAFRYGIISLGEHVSLNIVNKGAKLRFFLRMKSRKTQQLSPHGGTREGSVQWFTD